MRAFRPLIYLLAAALLLLGAGCGWTSGPTFQGEYDSEGNDPVTAVQKWFASMELPKTENEEGELVVDQEGERDFDLYLEVLNPSFLMDPNGMVIGGEELEQLRERWNSKDWRIEFKDIVLEEVANDGEKATVKITGGSIRYIGKEMFGSAEYQQDNFGEKGGEIYLEYYLSDENDPLLSIPGMEDRAEDRWVVVGGLDLSEKTTFGETP